VKEEGNLSAIAGVSARGPNIDWRRFHAASWEIKRRVVGYNAFIGTSFVIIICYNRNMVLIGMAEAARRAGTTVDGIRNGLRNAHFPFVEISARALAVEEANLEAYSSVE
jgi:hypothetical protein